MLIYAISAVSLALLFYTLAVFLGPARKRYSPLPLYFFALGIVSDLLGTVLMSLISPGFTVDLHTVIGLLALVMMIILAGWSLVEYRRGFSVHSARRRGYALISWSAWVAVFILGAIGR